MTTAADLLIFQHNPLQDAKTHIRLLKVVSVGEADPVPVRCELTAFAIAEAPPYRAISYTWGDPAFLTPILVNGNQLDVRLNCEYALRQASHDEGGGLEDRFIWIDSICVNQKDNDEKSAQVAMMGDIFKRASRVLACVGAHDEDSAFLYDFLRGEGPRVRSLLLADAPRYADGSSDVTFMHNSISFRKAKVAWRWKHPRSHLIRLCEAVTAFLARPYFHRVWIYQELFLGRGTSIYCGNDKVPISWLWVTGSIIRSWMGHRTHYLLFMKLLMRIRMRPTIRDAMPLLQAGANELSLISFLRATTEVSALLCEDPRDRVYGILSITTPVGAEHFQPDYTKDRMDLAVEVLEKAAAELFADNCDFSRLTEFALTVGLNLNLRDEPSEKLVCAIESRLSSTNLQDAEFKKLNKTDGTKGTSYWPFLGFQVLCQQDKWVFRNQHKWFRRYGSKLEPPELTQCLKGDKFSYSSGNIHLPPEAQHGDWILMSHSYDWFKSPTYSYDSKVAFLARPVEDEKFEIIGKILISKWLSKWSKAFEKGASKFRFFCDHEDLLALFALCDWESLSWTTMWQDSEPSDTFFQMRFCGQRFSSYAIRTES